MLEAEAMRRSFVRQQVHKEQHTLLIVSYFHPGQDRKSLLDTSAKLTSVYKNNLPKPLTAIPHWCVSFQKKEYSSERYY